MFFSLLHVFMHGLLYADQEIDDLQAENKSLKKQLKGIVSFSLSFPSFPLPFHFSALLSSLPFSLPPSFFLSLLLFIFFLVLPLFVCLHIMYDNCCQTFSLIIIWIKWNFPESQHILNSQQVIPLLVIFLIGRISRVLLHYGTCTA